jgi:lysophospholipase L1-like esterase
MLKQVVRAALLLIVFLSLAPAASAQTAADEYVSLGDSFVAGPLIPPQLPPFGCLKSGANYPHLAQVQLGVQLRDPSCSGADTKDMTEPQGVTPGPNPPQFDALTQTTDYVTLGIGGNDIGFSEIVRNCVSQSRTGSPCKDRYTAGGTDQISQRIQETAPKVAAVIQGIHERASEARVFVVNYPAVLPDSGRGCWPIMPVADGDVPYLRDKEKELNQMLADQAAANAAEVIDWYTPSIGHDACKPPGVKWVEPVVPTNAAAPVHPNVQGMIAASGLVITALRQPAPAPAP